MRTEPYTETHLVGKPTEASPNEKRFFTALMWFVIVAFCLFCAWVKFNAPVHDDAIEPTRQLVVPTDQYKHGNEIGLAVLELTAPVAGMIEVTDTNGQNRMIPAELAERNQTFSFPNDGDRFTIEPWGMCGPNAEAPSWATEGGCR